MLLHGVCHPHFQSVRPAGPVCHGTVSCAGLIPGIRFKISPIGAPRSSPSLSLSAGPRSHPSPCKASGIPSLSSDFDDTIDEAILEAARDPAVSLLAQQILEAEAELKAIFEPGKPMPAASMVAKKRAQISDMKELLAAKLNGNEARFDPNAGDDEAERARLLFLEVEKSLQRQQRPQHMQESNYNFELAMLEAENERLREKAEAVLRRQQLLEDLAQKHGLLTVRDNQLVWTRSLSKEMQAKDAVDNDRRGAAPAQGRAEMAVGVRG